jgi:TonB family protein
VWLAESKKSAGIRFVDLTADARNQISNWIASEKPAPEVEGLMPAPVQSLISTTLENFPTEPIGSGFPEQDQPSSPERIAYTASQGSEIVTPEILDASPLSLVEDLQEKVHRHTPVAGYAPQVQTGKVDSSADRIEDSPSHLYVLEISGFQVAALMFLFAVISLALGLTVGRGPLGIRLRDAQKSILAVDATSPALPDRPGETTSRTSTSLAANTFNTPAGNPPALETEESLMDSGNSSDTNKLHDATPSEKKSKESTRGSESFAKVTSTDSSLSPTMESKPSSNPEASPERKGSTGLIARNAPPPVNSQPAHSPKAVGPISGAPRNSAPRRVTPATRSGPHLSSPSTILVTGPGDGRKPFRLVLPQKPIAASSSFAMTSQLSVLVSPEPGPALAHQPARLQAGELVSFVWPRYPRPGDRHGSSETVKVRTTIGELGQVLDVKRVSGSVSLLPAAMSAIRLWRYKPTLLNSRPVQAQQDVTIAFRPPQHSPRVPTRHPSHN